MNKPIPVQVGETTYYVHPMTAGQFVRWHAYATAKDSDKVTADFMVYALCVKDADGKPVFSSSVEAEGMSLETRSLLRPVVERVNGFDTDEDEKKDNSGTTTPS